MSVRRPSSVVPTLLIMAALSGCAGNEPQLQSLSLPSTPPPSPPDTTAPQVGATPDAPPPNAVVVGQMSISATDVYARIAHGAMGCWFAVGGPLKKDYIFHATADAPSRGGKAEIVIHQRDLTQPNPRGPKAYIVEIQPTGESSATITAENRKMSDAFAVAMTDDVSRWSKGEDGCTGPSTAAGWAPAPPEATVAAPPAKKAKTQKAKLKAAQAKPAEQP